MASTWQKTQEFYNWILESGDPRTDPWPLVYSPLPVTLVFTSYLFMVALGPSCMRQRRRLELRAPLLAYNLAMVALSSYMFYEFLVTSVLANYSYLCQPVDYSRNGKSVLVVLLLQSHRAAGYGFLNSAQETRAGDFSARVPSWLYALQLVVRGQIRAWRTRCASFFVGMLNSFVHIFMYGYYALASLGPRMRRHLWWKRYLTILQLCQFVAIAAHSSYNLFTECPFPDGFNTAVFLYILSLLALFLHFYYQTYIRGKQEKLT
ncbi:elongation of very long chain fatty acids protein 4-like isoform X3 [Vidua chalybeata]|uniref:elongation of very long chain fatty acids protein 4-like isoform X3 n=1 Tax=Vidua chalybeata TaxID=81927 RepID=UPI0023A83B30|nr:elongation of very long chain fatty acids protein 4-like isoform X3 [Vidua chalybeata]